MFKSHPKQVLRHGKARAGLWVPLLLLLLLSVVVTGAVAQDDKGADVGDLIFLENDDTASPENVEAAAGEVWIKVRKDAYLASGDPNRNFGTSELMRFGYQPGGLGATRPIFKYKVEEDIPSDAMISKAELHVYLTGIRDTDTNRGYAAHNVTEAWDEPFVTWNTMPNYGDEIGRGKLGSSPGWQITDITDQVQDWLKNPDKNKGIILVGDERSDQNFERDYYAKETTSGLYPRLYVKYDVSKDDVAPEARVVQPSPGGWSPADFVVAWEGHDPPNSDGSSGSGIRWYDVFYSNDVGHSWEVGRAQVTETQTNVTAAPHTQKICFYARAMDNAGNEGPWPSGSASIQSCTHIDAQPPQATVNPLPEYSAHHTFTVSWQETSEQGHSGLRYYDVQYREQDGTWHQLDYETTDTSAQFRGEDGITYEFRARGVDNVGNVQEWGAAQAHTTVWTEPLAYIVPFDPNIYQKKPVGPEPGDGFLVEWVGLTPPGTSIVNFDVRYMRPGNPSWLQFYSGTATSKQFDLAVGDPDGVYIFQARAKDSAGVQGQFHQQLESRMIVNRHEPWMEPQTLMPFIAGGH